VEVAGGRFAIVVDLNAGSVLMKLAIPLDVIVEARIKIIFNGSNASLFYVHSPLDTDNAARVSVAPLANVGNANAADVGRGAQIICFSDTAQQVGVRGSVPANAGALLSCASYRDPRRRLF
jgi:hypothetical protein